MPLKYVILNQLAGIGLIKEPKKPKNIATRTWNKTLKSRKNAWRKCTINISRMVKYVVRKTLKECIMSLKSNATSLKILTKKRFKTV
jgi:hypothetical protein